MDSYAKTAQEARLKVLEMVYKAKSSHIGSNFSVIDILTVLFANLKEHDQVILSAGWKAAAFYYFLAKRGDFPEEWLDTYNQEGSKLIGLTEPGVPGVLFAGGSMQMGLPAAVGFALAKKIKNEEGRVYCIASDGEIAGGMFWESILIARQHGLDNLKIIVDYNGLQAMGPTKDILGWKEMLDIEPEDMANGHDFEEIEVTLLHEKDMILLFETVKGKGVPFMENDNFWHYKDLSDLDYESAKAELS